MPPPTNQNNQQQQQNPTPQPPPKQTTTTKENNNIEIIEVFKNANNLKLDKGIYVKKEYKKNRLILNRNSSMTFKITFKNSFKKPPYLFLNYQCDDKDNNIIMNLCAIEKKCFYVQFTNKYLDTEKEIILNYYAKIYD